MARMMWLYYFSKMIEFIDTFVVCACMHVSSLPVLHFPLVQWCLNQDQSRAELV